MLSVSSGHKLATTVPEILSGRPPSKLRGSRMRAEGKLGDGALGSVIRKTKTANPLPKMIPGAVCAQKVRCGKQSCKCQSGDLHGPYFYYFSRKGGKLIKRYVRKADVRRVRDACTRYQDVERQKRNLIRAHLRHWSSFREELREAANMIATRRRKQHV